MVITALVFRFSRAFARRVPRIAVLIAAEYVRAMLAASRYEELKRLGAAELRRRRIGAGGVPRAVFEMLYCE
jgi:hypothetical protein